MRPTLEDHGINFTGKWIGTFYGMAAGGLDKRGAFDQSLHFDLKVDSPETHRLVDWLEGLAGVAGVCYRDGLNVNMAERKPTYWRSPQRAPRALQLGGGLPNRFHAVES